ncbi:C40 family peptidase [Clostridium sp. BJN0001]|uniref:C40 family peptidase n=1 Tax=Clostridium sp. BJN0001 TaxID=2930219 RepID=UPI001FD32F32|nr:C40 family peptidase [Clostridium sp. BJN0001]
MDKKKIITFLVTVSIFCTGSKASVLAVPINENIEIESTSDTELQKIQDIILKIQECDNNIETKTNKLNELKCELDEKEKQIEENQKKIESLEQEADEKDKQLGERLKCLSEDGGLQNRIYAYVDALTSSKNILEVVQNVGMVSKICENDAKLINDAKESKEDISDIQKKTENEKKELEDDKNYVDKELSDLENEKQNLLDYIEENSSLLNETDGIIKPITLSADISGSAKNVIIEAQKYLGVPYVWGGTTPDGFDCSGLMQYVFNAEGISIPRTSQMQQQACTKIDISEIKPGDLVFNKASDATHVGLYIGNDMYLQAPHTGDVVKISKLSMSNMKYSGRVIE